ncbi:MAG: FAD-binding oxidoreductase [Lachnospiraceae bacterium]|nr:FAD-binding oxidoreductase [Lachnospiraceae bacterium]
MNAYHKLTKEDVEYLKSITAPERVYFEEEIEYDYHHDEMPDFGTFPPEVVVLALSTEEVSAVMKYAWENNIPVTPRGAGTGLAGGCVPLYGGILLSLEKMNKILEWNLDNMTVVVEPGVLVMELANAAIEQGVFYPPEPGEKTASIGGNVMTNAGGMKAVGYGVTRSYVVDMEAVMPDGSVMQFGSNVVKNTSGYDVKDLIIGSEGTLCIATKLRMRVITQPKYSNTLLVPYGSLEECLGTVPKFIRSDLNPAAIEYMPHSLIEEAAKYLNKIMPHRTANSYLILMFDGQTEEDVERRCDEAAKICLESGAEDVFLCNTDERKDAVWTVRGSALEALKASSPDMDECDIVVPRNRIVDFSHFADQLMEKYGIRISIQGHAGDGNMHIQLMKDDMDKELFLKRGPLLMNELYEKAKELDGQVSGEHGIGHARVEALENHMGDRMITLYRAIKNAFDEKNILNPGKIIRLK